MQHENQKMPQGVKADTESPDRRAPGVVRMEGESNEEWLKRVYEAKAPNRFKVVRPSAFGPLPCP